ncbi:ATP-binding protein [uncultured Mameliella sp.]|uniref:AAA family ATPase n=2 Tax=uncultured Mameliella sp. TaxID=1447087 RepID=UPI00260B5AC4|nr:ATP-binding protein [uncultured Mameliella sp.]
MSPEYPTLHVMCGKIAAGKSTLANRLAGPKGAVLITEDAWLGALFADQMATPRDYVRCTGKLRAVMGPHVAALLRAGVSVVLDFAANTVEQRAWVRGILEETGAAHQLHLLAPPDEVCLERLRRRNASGTHPFVVTDEQFHQFSRHFVPPGPDEGFNVVTHDAQV